jgi:transcriptional regulator with GAF, ATPase, and Fis domain
VFPIRVPPLRERAEDVPLLVLTFLEEFCARMGKKITQVSRGTMEALQRYPWPGNVRELRNVIEHGASETGITKPSIRRAVWSPSRFRMRPPTHFGIILCSTSWAWRSMKWLVTSRRERSASPMAR